MWCLRLRPAWFPVRMALPACVLWATAMPGLPVALAQQALKEEARTLELQKRYPESIERYRASLEQQPDDDDTRGALAKLLSWQGQYDEAEQLYRGILTRHPIDHDVRTALARLLSWQRRLPEAEVLYQELLRETPDDGEVRRGLGDVLFWQGQSREALVQYRLAQAVVKDPELGQRIEQLTAELEMPVRVPVGSTGGQVRLPYRDYLKAGYSHYSYTKGIPNERDFLLEGAKSFGDKTLIARIEPLNRFGFHDTPLSAELYSPLWQKAWGYIAGQATVNPSFAPNYSVTGEVVQGMGLVHPSLARVELSMGYRRLLYKKDNIDLITPGFNLYLPYSVWITEKIYFVPNTGAITLSSQITWRPADRLQLFASYGFGTSGERIVATQDFARVTSHIIQGGVIFPIASKFSGEAVGYYEDRGILYIRRGGTFNLIYHW